MELKIEEDALRQRQSGHCHIPEFLRPTATANNTPNVDCSINKRKHHRRAKKGWKRRSADEDEVLKKVQNKNVPPPLKVSPQSLSSSSAASTSSKKFRKGGKKKQVYLRPTNGPLLKAPRNSTQFIIDDHEESDLYLNFSGGPNQNNSSSSNKNNNNAKDGGDNEAEASLADHESAGSSDPSPDDDTFWAEYSERDFQSVYESAHQEVVSNWDKKKICDEIASLERRQKELVNVLARLDPDVYLQKLQSELATIQEENRVLRVVHSELNPALPDSSTNEDTTDTQWDINGEEDMSEEQQLLLPQQQEHGEGAIGEEQEQELTQNEAPSPF